jgi:hypothetical protein
MSMGDIGQIQLIKLIGHESPFVKLWASTHGLRIDENKSVECLNRLSKEKGFLGFDAKMVLSEWKKGNISY